LVEELTVWMVTGWPLGSKAMLLPLTKKAKASLYWPLT
jgi:hypothetical protein